MRTFFNWKILLSSICSSSSHHYGNYVLEWFFPNCSECISYLNFALKNSDSTRYPSIPKRLTEVFLRHYNLYFLLKTFLRILKVDLLQMQTGKNLKKKKCCFLMALKDFWIILITFTRDRNSNFLEAFLPISNYVSFFKVLCVYMSHLCNSG